MRLTKVVNILLHTFFNKHIIVRTLPKNKVMLNIGSGAWQCDGWTNLDYPTEWYKKAQIQNAFIPYDIRSDDIPFSDNSVDRIYCCHVIEHIENTHILKMFSECFRILKKNGIMRITTPDAEFLYTVSKYNTGYWNWRHDWVKRFCNNQHAIRNVDYLVAEIATPKMLQYIHSSNKEDYISLFESMDMYDFLEHVTNNLEFRKEFPGDHINYWTFEKINTMLTSIGFSSIIRSKWSGSCCEYMADILKFDKTHPQMSLYVDVVK